jgi:hypothetical protein
MRIQVIRYYLHQAVNVIMPSEKNYIQESSPGMEYIYLPCIPLAIPDALLLLPLICKYLKIHSSHGLFGMDFALKF